MIKVEKHNAVTGGKREKKIKGRTRWKKEKEIWKGRKRIRGKRKEKGRRRKR